MTYLITYELSKSKDYTNLYNEIKNIGPWWHYLDATWFVESTLSANEISEKLLPHIDKSSDFLIVIKVDSTNKQGWLPKKAWDWLNS